MEWKSLWRLTLVQLCQLSELTYTQLCEVNGKQDLMPSDIRLKSYTGHQIGVLGSCLVTEV